MGARLCSPERADGEGGEGRTRQETRGEDPLLATIRLTDGRTDGRATQPAYAAT
jgi:hypothetical protein